MCVSNLANECKFSNSVPDDVHSARRSVDDVDVLSTLERCYKIIHEHRKESLSSNTSTALTSARISVVTNLSRFMKRSIFDDIKHRQTRLDHNLFDIIWPAMKKINKERSVDEDLDSGVVIPDFDCYVVFQEFLMPFVLDMHGLNTKNPDEIDKNLKNNHQHNARSRTMYFPQMAIEQKKEDLILSKRLSEDYGPDQLNEIHLNLDTTNKLIKGCVVECSRNLDDCELNLPVNLTIGQLEQSERIIIGKLLTLDFSKAIDEEEELGMYLTMNEILEQSTEIYSTLAESGLLIPILDDIDHGQYWPYGRGVYVSNKNDLVVWVNVQEHLRVLCCTPNNEIGDIGQAYSKCGKAIEFLEEKLKFRYSHYLGNLSSRPSFLGTSLKFYYTLALPNLMKDVDNLRELCATRGLQMTTKRFPAPQTGDSSSKSVAGSSRVASSQGTGNICVNNKQSLGITEWKLFMDYCTAIASILQLEKEMSMSNTKQIATMLVNIFRKKKHTLSEVNPY